MAKKGELKRYLKSVSLDLLYERRQEVKAREEECRQQARRFALCGILLDREISRREVKRD